MVDYATMAAHPARLRWMHFACWFFLVQGSALLAGGIEPAAAVKPPAADAGVDADADALFDRATDIVREARTDPRREREAIPLFLRAAEAGHLQAMYELYWLYEDVSSGDGEETRRRDGEQAALWLRKAAEGGHLRATFSYGIQFAFKGDVATAEKWLLPTARKGDKDAMRALGLMYVGQMNSVPRNKIDIARGLSWLRRAGDNFDGSALYTLGMLHFQGQNGVAKDDALAFEYLARGARTGSTLCMLPLAMCYADGVGVAADPAEAFKWTRIAAEMPGGPDADACAQLAAMYDVGVGTPKDKRQAEQWYRKAAEAGDERAKLRLAQPDMRHDAANPAAAGAKESGGAK